MAESARVASKLLAFRMCGQECQVGHDHLTAVTTNR